MIINFDLYLERKKTARTKLNEINQEITDK